MSAAGLAMTVSMRTESSDQWATPADIFGPLDDEFRFDLDVAASATNAKCASYFTEQDNRLWHRWAPRRCWMNPPYGGETTRWVAKAAAEASDGALVVGLLPARTDTAWFHEHVLASGAEVRFVRGRVAFDLPGVRIRPRAPFPSLIVVWRPPTWIGGRR